MVLLLIVVLVPTATPRSNDQATNAGGALGQPQGTSTGASGTPNSPGVVSAGGDRGSRRRHDCRGRSSGWGFGRRAGGPGRADEGRRSQRNALRSGQEAGRVVGLLTAVRREVLRQQRRRDYPRRHGLDHHLELSRDALGRRRRNLGRHRVPPLRRRTVDYVADLNTYINYFNSQFELYGRRVVIKTYNGQGDYIQEDQGQGADVAQSDAATAHSLDAFGDVTFQLRGSNPYWTALAQQRIVAWGPLGFPTSYYQRTRRTGGPTPRRVRRRRRGSATSPAGG